MQRLGEFDTKTSSWIRTPSQIRKLGGALFCDRRYDTVFVYHNGAESYYARQGVSWLAPGVVPSQLGWPRPMQRDLYSRVQPAERSLASDEPLTFVRGRG